MNTLINTSSTSKIVVNVAAWIIASIVTQNVAYALVGIGLNAAIGGISLFTDKNS